MLKLSETPTDCIAMRVNCDNEYAEAPALAILHLTPELRASIERRAAAAQQMLAADEGFYNACFRDQPEGYYTWSGPVAFDQDDYTPEEEAWDEITEATCSEDFVFVEGFTEGMPTLAPFEGLRGHAVTIDKDGCFWFECYHKHGGQTYSTPGLSLPQLFTI